MDLFLEGNPVIHLHRERQFTGELDLFNRRRMLVGGRFRPLITAEVVHRDEQVLRCPSTC